MQKPAIVAPEELRSARLTSGLSLAELAHGICSESYLSLIEAGKRTPSKKIREQLITRLQSSSLGALPDALSLDCRVAEMALKIGDASAAEKASAAIESSNERKYIEALRFELEGKLSVAVSSLKELLAHRVVEGLLRTKVALAFTRVSRDIGFTDQAIACGEEELARTTDGVSDESESAILELRAVLSSCYLTKGNIPRALAIADSISVAETDSWEKVISLWTRASALEASGDFAGALEASNLASEICKRIDRPIAEIRLKLNALQCRIELDEIPAGIFLEFEFAKSFFRSMNLNLDVAEALLIESRARFQIADFMEAERLLDEALVEVGQEASELKVRILISMSECCLANESKAKARYYLELAHSELTSYFEVSPTMASSWRQIAMIYSQLGEVSKGFECLLKATEVLGLPATVSPEVNQPS